MLTRFHVLKLLKNFGLTSKRTVYKTLKTEETSIGLDFELFNKQLSGSIDWYDKTNTNAILYVKPIVTYGRPDNYATHVGEVNNTGLEFSLNWNKDVNDHFKYWIGGNISYNKNELAKLNTETLSVIRGGGLGNGEWTKLLDNSSVGQPLGSFYLYETAGMDEEGNFLYLNADGEKVVASKLTQADRKYMGSINPDYYYGLNAGFNYKNFDMSINAYGTIGSKVYNGKKAQRFSGENIEYDVATDFWLPENTGAANPYPFNDVPRASDYYLESGDFFRINNISLGYTIKEISDDVQSIRIYASAINPFIWQKFSGYSPELRGDDDPYGTSGVELDAYPTLRSFIVGLNVKF